MNLNFNGKPISVHAGAMDASAARKLRLPADPGSTVVRLMVPPTDGQWIRLEALSQCSPDHFSLVNHLAIFPVRLPDSSHRPVDIVASEPTF